MFTQIQFYQNQTKLQQIVDSFHSNIQNIYITSKYFIFIQSTFIIQSLQFTLLFFELQNYLIKTPQSYSRTNPSTSTQNSSKPSIMYIASTYIPPSLVKSVKKIIPTLPIEPQNTHPQNKPKNKKAQSKKNNNQLLIYSDNQLISIHDEINAQDRQCKYLNKQYMESSASIANTQKQILLNQTLKLKMEEAAKSEKLIQQLNYYNDLKNKKKQQKLNQMNNPQHLKLAKQYELMFQKLKLASQIIAKRNLEQVQLKYALIQDQSILEAKMLQIKEVNQKGMLFIKQSEIRTSKRLEQLTKIQATGREVFEQKKRYNNALQDRKGNIRVYCRIRPYIKNDNGSKIEYQITQNYLNIIKAPSDSSKSTYRMKPLVSTETFYLFQKIFREDVAQNQIFQELSELVQCSMDGKNVCIFAYGQTGSGKTFTMKGDLTDKNGSNRGFIPRSLQYIFNQVQICKEKGYASEISVSVCQIYNGKVRDLLQGEEGAKIPRQQYDQRINKRPFKQVTSSNNKKIIPITVAMIKQKGGDRCKKDLHCSQINDYNQGLTLLTKSMQRRKTGTTKMNDQSSRSHLIFQVNIRTAYEINIPLDGNARSSSLVLIDLAGSQRIKDSKVTGTMLEESKQINKSLTELGKVMRAMKDGTPPSFRSSKLTQVLSQYLQKDGKAVMFVNVSPELKDLDQTMNSLTFAQGVRQCKIIGNESVRSSTPTTERDE